MTRTPSTRWGRLLDWNTVPPNPATLAAYRYDIENTATCMSALIKSPRHLTPFLLQADGARPNHRRRHPPSKSAPAVGLQRHWPPTPGWSPIGHADPLRGSLPRVTVYLSSYFLWGIKMATKVTSNKAASRSSSVLSSASTGSASKSAAGSALAQVAPPKATSTKAATAASAVLRDGRTSVASKSAAGSALAQRARGKSK